MRQLTVVILLWGLFAAPALSEDDGAHALQPERTLMSPHQRALHEHRFDATSPDLIGPADTPHTPLRQTAATYRPCSTVFGFLPYWESSSNIQWDRITHLACFSVAVNANGTLGDDHGWPWTSTINTAHANDVKVILVATLFDNDNITTLINNPTYVNNFFVNIKNKMAEGSADGLNIDFETGGGGSTAWRTQIHTFMDDLTTYLHAEVPGSEVTFDGPAVNWSPQFNLSAIADNCDGIFIMGYAFAGSWSTSTWPNAPLEGGSYDITNTVEVQYAGVDPAKLILGVPYYGHHWTTTSSSAYATVTGGFYSTRFRDDQGNSQTYGRIWDANTQTPWYRYQISSTWHQVWYDDEESLGLKYQLAIDNDYQGVGMWALGYDGTRTELWDKIEEMFVDGCPPEIGDADGDGDVDLTDHNYFRRCMAGPDVTPPNVTPFFRTEHCLAAFDVEDDGDVDLADFRAFQEEYTGPLP
ncbi:MAG: glycoside hydrolase family 18 protein [bacterium]|nr:glycoside hydrolase family 18 protein [bacterium]